MAYMVTGTAAMEELYRQNDVESSEEAQEVMDKMTTSFQAGEFKYSRPCAKGWLPEQLCLTVVKKGLGMVDHRNVKR